MKRYSFLVFLLLVAFCAPVTSCSTANVKEDGTTQGYSGARTGYTREKVYDWQDRTFRQLAY